MKRIAILLILLFNVQVIHGQNNTVSCGGNAFGSGGTITYSIGQTDYNSISGASGNVNQGVQQPYEIFTLSNSPIKGIEVTAIVYPNPTSNSIELSIAGNINPSLVYQLYDESGKLLSEAPIEKQVSTIDLTALARSSYFLKISLNSKELKIFKIIKN